MNKEKLKKELHELIENIEDEETLIMVKEDIVAYKKTGAGFDDLSDLTAEERADLEESIKEDPDKDVVSEEEFNNHIKAWRKNYLQKAIHK